MPTEIVATARSDRGEVVLRRRDDGELELRVNGIFVMDTVETTTESALADLALEPSHPTGRSDPAEPGVKVLVGGLGLGFTLRQLLGQDTAGEDRVLEIKVVEIEGALIEWHRRGLIPTTAGIVDDSRLSLVEGDVRDVVSSLGAGTLDALILDVDNGPGFLVYDDNAAVYRTPFLTTCHRALRDSGRLVVWSADDAPELERALRAIFRSIEHHVTEVELGVRAERYHAYTAVKGLRKDPRCLAP